MLLFFILHSWIFSGQPLNVILICRLNIIWFHYIYHAIFCRYANLITSAFIKYLLWDWFYTLCFIDTLSFNPHNNYVRFRLVLLSSFYRWENWNFGGLSNLPSNLKNWHLNLYFLFHGFLTCHNIKYHYFPQYVDFLNNNYYIFPYLSNKPLCAT